jgi:hypothetical protein
MKKVALFVAVMASATAGCDKGDGGGGQGAAVEPTGSRVLGVEARDFQCSSLITVSELEAMLGGPVIEAAAPFDPPMGTPRPCNYLVSGDGGQEAWSFDMDCRADALKLAGRMMDGYRASPGDAGAADVSIGRGGLDHHGQALIFVDDDAPCFVRVIGPRADGRAALGAHVAGRLNESVAPMPRAYRK